ncbi:MAG TPA: S24 family peptidase [Burkholderiales bacterium]|nr:S24 family peptidase [Burkholderiales bacterium]
MTMADRIKRRMGELRLTQDDLAKALRVSQPAIHKLMSGKTLKTKNIIQLAKTLQVSPDWLENGGTKSNIEAGPTIYRVPLISSVQAGQWQEIADNFQPGDAEKYIYTTKHVSPYAFALRVTGDSMTNPYGAPSYPDGCIIIVEPEQVVKSGNRAVVRLEDTQEATFKVYVEDAGRRYLKPLNPRYPIMEISSRATICGKVVQSIIDEE